MSGEINPAVVYCSISGFVGRLRAHPAGYDLIARPPAVWMSITGVPRDRASEGGEWHLSM